MLDLIKRHHKVVIVALLFSFAYFIFSANLNRHRKLYIHERAILALISPIQKLITFMVDGVVDVWSHYVYLVHVSQENDRLLREKGELELKLAEFVEAAIENERLRELLVFRDRIVAPKISAEVIALDLSSQFQMLRIDRGQYDQIALGMPVVSSAGLVGQVFRVGKHFCDVLLATDRNSSIDAVIQRSRAQGIVSGAGRKIFEIKFKYLSRVEDVRVGDLVVTSGLDGVFPEGLSIGYVTQVQRPEVGIFQGATIQPTVDFSRIQEVLVVLKQNRPELPGFAKGMILE